MARKTPFPGRVAALALCCVLGLAAGSMAVSLDDIRSAGGALQSVSARFTQEKHMKILVKPLVSTGVFIYQAPDSLRFEYLAPVRSILIMNQGTVDRYLLKGDTLVRDSTSAMGAMQVVMDEITRWIKGDIDTAAFDAAVTELPVPGRITLTPRDPAMARFIQSIEMDLSDQPGVFRSVTIREDQDSFTRLRFDTVTVNAPVDPAVFSVQP